MKEKEFIFNEGYWEGYEDCLNEVLSAFTRSLRYIAKSKNAEGMVNAYNEFMLYLHNIKARLVEESEAEQEKEPELTLEDYQRLAEKYAGKGNVVFLQINKK